MSRKAAAPVTREELADRRAAHTPRYWMLITPDEAREVAEGRIPEQVQRMAQWLAADPPWKEG